MTSNTVTLSRKSPTLYLYWDLWSTKYHNWICDSELKKLFYIPKGVQEINLFASYGAIHGRTYEITATYQPAGIEICTARGSECYMVYTPLFEWIEYLRVEGRNHFGVEY